MKKGGWKEPTKDRHGEANIFEGAFKIIDARFVLHPQTLFRAFPIQVVVAVHHFFNLVGVYRASPP